MQYSHTPAAVLAISLLLIYVLAINHVALPPLNNLAAAGSQLPSTLTALIPFCGVLIGLARNRQVWIYIGWLWSVLWLLLQIRQWWLPYFFGPTVLHENFAWYFQHGYAQTMKIVAIAQDRPTPDLQHNILQFLSLVVVLTLGLRIRKRAKRS